MAPQREEEVRLQGTGASPGVVLGPALRLEEEKAPIPQYTVEEKEIEGEVERFHQALAETGRQLEAIKARVEEELDAQQAAIFGAHLLVLEDPALVEEVEKRIRATQNAPQAVQEVVEELAQMLHELEDDYLRQRAADVRDVGGRLLRNILGVQGFSLSAVPSGAVILAQDLEPSQTAQLTPDRVAGFATAAGGYTSHAAILARSLEIPAVVGLGPELLHVQPGEQDVALDGATGEVVLAPSPETRARFIEKQQKEREERQRLGQLREYPAETRDGHPVELAANLGSPAEVERVQKAGAAGVGLFRTEFLFLGREEAPSEEEQYAAYREVAERLAPNPVIIRTLDVGGDKDIPYLDLPRELNPFLGWRAIRFCLDRPKVFRTQLAAILRAGAHGRVLLMYPMVCDREELQRARNLLEEVKEDLDRRGVEFDRQPQVGIMVETPAAALAADALAPEVDFFSLGTNDLVQYTMAVDRGNDRVRNLFQPFHPAVLRLIREVIEAGHRHQIWVGMCGEMAGDTRATPILLGLGLDEFSMNPGSLPRVKQAVRALSRRNAQQVATRALELGSSREVLELAEKTLQGLGLQAE